MTFTRYNEKLTHSKLRFWFKREFHSKFLDSKCVFQKICWKYTKIHVRILMCLKKGTDERCDFCGVLGDVHLIGCIKSTWQDVVMQTQLRSGFGQIVPRRGRPQTAMTTWPLILMHRPTLPAVLLAFYSMGLVLQPKNHCLPRRRYSLSAHFYWKHSIFVFGPLSKLHFWVPLFYFSSSSATEPWPFIYDTEHLAFY